MPWLKQQITKTDGQNSVAEIQLNLGLGVLLCFVEFDARAEVVSN